MNPELARRIAFTLGALLVYRIGSHIPMPGIDLAVWGTMFRAQQGGLLGTVNTFTGGAIARLSVLSLGIMPFISAAIIVQLMSFCTPALRRLRHAGEQGRRAIDRYTLAMTVFLTAFQAYGIAVALESAPNLALEPGLTFRLITIVTLSGGSLFLVWLAEQISVRGVGNGIALILCAGIVTTLPQSVVTALELNRLRVLSDRLVLGTVLLGLALVVLVVTMERARRREPVVFSRPGAAPAFLSFKLNGAGIVPALFAPWLLELPLIIIAWFAPDPAEIGRSFSHGTPLYLLCQAIVVVFFVYLYTALVADPSAAAAEVERLGGAIPQVAPGEATADHLDGVLSRITLVGAAYLVTVCLIPELLISWAEVPFYLGGTSILVLVCTILDVESEVRGLSQMRLGG